MKTLKHKGYEGTAELDTTGKVYLVKVPLIDDTVAYKIDSAADLQKEFEDIIDYYIEGCETLDREL